MNKRRIVFKLIVSILCLVSFLVGCNTIGGYNPYSSKYYLKEDNSLFKVYAEAEARYLFFGFGHSLGDSDTVNLWFPEAISSLDFTDFKLAYGDEIIEATCDLEPIDKAETNYHGMRLNLYDYIPEFDHIIIMDENKPLSIYTGYFCFEKGKTEDSPLEYKYYLLPYHNISDRWKDDITEFSIEPIYKGKVHAILPQAVPEEFFSSELHHVKNEKNKSFYKHILKPNREAWKSSGLKRVEIELHYCLDNEAKEKFQTDLYASRIPFQSN